MNTSAVRPPASLPRLTLARCPRSLAPTLVTLPSMSLIPSAPLQAGHTANIFQDDSRVWAGVGYSRSVATGGSARVATGKRRGGAGADRIGQDLHLRAALSEPENSGGVHRPDPRSSCAFTRCIQDYSGRRSCIISGL